MSVDIRRISVAVRECGDGGVWRMIDGRPQPVAVLMCDIRRGRSAELRLEVAKSLCRHCIEILGLHEDRLNVEFTQHAGDEMYHPTLGGYSPGGLKTRGRGRDRFYVGSSERFTPGKPTAPTPNGCLLSMKHPMAVRCARLALIARTSRKPSHPSPCSPRVLEAVHATPTVAR